MDKRYKVGDVVTVQTIIVHPMDTGFATDKHSGEFIPKFYVNDETIYFNDKYLTSFELGVSASANPKIKFMFKVTGPGILKVVFKNNKGEAFEKTTKVTPS